MYEHGSLVDGITDTEEEYRTLAFLRANRPELTRRYLANLPRARGVTLRRFVEALIREGNPRTDGDRAIVALALPAGGALVVRPHPGFPGTSRIAGPVTRCHDGSSEEVVHPIELVNLIEGVDDTPEPWQRLRRGIAESVANLALSYAAVEDRTSDLRAVAGTDLISFSRRYARATRDPGAALFFEGLCADGHNLHPCGRMRLGFSPADNLRYTAEGGRTTALRFVAVAAGTLLETVDEHGRDVGSLLFDHFPSFGGHARAILARRGLPADGYRFLPVHPWQFEHTIGAVYEEEIRDQRVVLLDGLTLPARPTVAIRSLVTPRGRHGHRLVVKTALDVHITSTRRTISPATTYNGPRLSQLLARIAATDEEIGKRMTPVAELAGAAFRAEDPTDVARLRNLSVLVREDPAGHAFDDTVLVPGCALYADSPLGGGTVLDQLVHRRSRDQRMAPAAAAIAVWRDYVDLLVPVVLRHLTRYGIGLEVHLQNTLLVCRGGDLVRLLVRDFGGIRVHLDRLRQAGLEYDPLPASVTATNDIGVVRAKISQTLVHDNLAELAFRLATRFGLSANELWHVVHECVVRAFAGMVACCGADRIEADRAALYASSIPHKAFVQMMLKADAGDLYLPVANPLARFASAPSR